MLNEILTTLNVLSCGGAVSLYIATRKAKIAAANSADSAELHGVISENLQLASFDNANNAARSTTASCEHMESAKSHRAAAQGYAIAAAQASTTAKDHVIKAGAHAELSAQNAQESARSAQESAKQDKNDLQRRLTQAELKIDKNDKQVRRDIHVELLRVGASIGEVQHHINALQEQSTVIAESLVIATAPKRPGNHIS